MSERIELFKNFCLPAIAAQSNNHFKWLIFLDTETKENFRSEIQTLLANYANFEAIYINGMPVYYENIQKKVSELAKNSAYLITSRIDNDDCVHKDFIENVQQNFQAQDFMAIDFVEGYTLQIQPEIKLGKKDHVFNPFISLIEKNINPKTVWFYDHTQWKKVKKIKQIFGKRIWLSIIHEKNKVNEFDGYGNVPWQNISQNFIVSDEINQKLNKNQIPENNWKWESFKNKLYVKWVIFNKLFKRKIGLYKLK